MKHPLPSVGSIITSQPAALPHRTGSSLAAAAGTAPAIVRAAKDAVAAIKPRMRIFRPIFPPDTPRAETHDRNHHAPHSGLGSEFMPRETGAPERRSCA